MYWNDSPVLQLVFKRVWHATFHSISIIKVSVNLHLLTSQDILLLLLLLILSFLHFSEVFIILITSWHDYLNSQNYAVSLVKEAVSISLYIHIGSIVWLLLDLLEMDLYYKRAHLHHQLLFFFLALPPSSFPKTKCLYTWNTKERPVMKSQEVKTGSECMFNHYIANDILPLVFSFLHLSFSLILLPLHLPIFPFSVGLM